ncbi:MAG: OpgC domain-containing protein [Gammaproteobacteria bacterium]|nr:OpgC domain-containing protein [Gammaproteobacteria bacterium]
MRSLKIDFFRGLALIIIFIDHVYNNRLGGYTLRGYGITDAAEIFFFCSGFVAALVYGRILESSGMGAAQIKAVRRALVIYAFHVAAFALLLALSVALKDLDGVETVLRHRQLHGAVYGDLSTALHIFTLNYQPFLFTILPAYMVLSVATPLFAWLLDRSATLVFGVSLTIYVLVQLYPDINFTQGPHGGRWVFNPFAYQFLFVIGMLFGHSHRHGRLDVPMRLDAAITAFLLLAVVFVFHNFIPFLQKHFALFPDYPLPGGLPWTGKVNEEPLRILHFLVLMYAVAYAMGRLGTRFPRFYRRLVKLAAPVMACGRNSIHIFALGILLSYIGGFVIASYGNGAEVWIPVNAVGVALLLCAGSWLASRRPGLAAGPRRRGQS